MPEETTTTPDGKLRNEPGDPAIVQSIFDARGNAIEVRCFSAPGTPRGCKWGSGVEGSIVAHTHDGSGRLTDERYFRPAEGATAGTPTGRSADDPTHRFHSEFDRRGYLLARTTFDTKGAPLLRFGEWKRTFAYNDDGALVSVKSFAVDGSPAVSSFGFHEIRYTVDANGRNTGIELHGIGGGEAAARSLSLSADWLDGATRVVIERVGTSVTNTWYAPGGALLKRDDACANAGRAVVTNAW